MRHEQTPRSVDYWRRLERIVAARVDAAMLRDEQVRGRLIPRLRDLEEIARHECDRRQTIQIIASARRLLGDRSDVGPSNGPFARSLGVVS